MMSIGCGSIGGANFVRACCFGSVIDAGTQVPTVVLVHGALLGGNMGPPYTVILSSSQHSADQRQSVADGEQDVGDARVGLDVVVEGDDRTVGLFLRVEDAAAPE